jgi:alkylresorcinol/alkylpyrone synthase
LWYTRRDHIDARDCPARRRAAKKDGATVAVSPRILSVGVARPPYVYQQEILSRIAKENLLGPAWRDDAARAEEARRIDHLFSASRVQQRYSVVDYEDYYAQPRSTGERMAAYTRLAYPLAREAVEKTLAEYERLAETISDFVVISCTGYTAPGLDITLARDLRMPRDARRVVIGHMGCYGAMVGLRQALSSLRAYPGATMLMLSVELCSLHFTQTLDPEALTGFALFGDGAAGVLLTSEEGATGPRLVESYCVADFGAASQMSWTITDTGFFMGLSPRVPVTLRRNISGVMDKLLTPHGLGVADVTHWLVHPGGPSILEAVQQKLELSDEQMALSWETLAEHGNCSSTTVLLMLERLLREGRARPGEWGVMMAFGPGLTLETCLLQF